MCGHVTRVAAIDCGTNSIRLLIADVDPASATLGDVDRRMEVVRLGEGVDRTRRFADAALRRTFDACERYAEAIRAAGAERVRFVATSASRDVVNRDAFVAGVVAAIGAEPEVISGDEEAALSFAGATLELLATDHERPFLVVDIGGGSTEFVLGDGAEPAQLHDHLRQGVKHGGKQGMGMEACSVDVGCVRLTERHLHSDPPTATEVAAAREEVAAGVALAGGTVHLDRTRTLVGLAGSVTTVAATALDLPAYDAERLHHAQLTAADVRAAVDRLVGMSRAERAALPFMHPGRVDVIGAGALVLEGVLDAVPVDELVVSEHDILDGIAWRLVGS